MRHLINEGNTDEEDEEFEVLMEDLELVDDEGMEEIAATDLALDEESDTFVPEIDQSCFTFSSHSGPVYACDFHPNGRTGASGCEDELLRAWDSVSANCLLEEKFEDSVTLVKFSHDGKYLAAVDLLGNFGCWQYSDDIFTKIHSMKLDSASWMEWHPQTNVLFLAQQCYFSGWKLPTFDVLNYFTLDSYSEAGCLMPDGKNALIGCNEGHAVILDLSSFTITSKLKYKDASNLDHGISAVDAHPDNNVVALGSKNGRVLLFTTKKPKVIGMVNVPEREDGNYIESVKFGRGILSGILLVAFDNHFHIYSQSKLVLRHQIVLSGHAVRLLCIEPYALVATSKAVVEVWDCRAGLKKTTLQGHTKLITDMVLSKDKKKLMTSSDDTHVKIFELTALL